MRACSILIAVLLGLGSGCVLADEVDDAMALVRQGKADEAYRLLLPLSRLQTGNTRLDVMLGIAALDSGRAEEAIVALERALSRQPALTAVRADLARAYLAVGRYVDARRELKQVMASKST